MSNTAQKCEGAKFRGDVNLFPALPGAWARGTPPLMLLADFPYEYGGGEGHGIDHRRHGWVAGLRHTGFCLDTGREKTRSVSGRVWSHPGHCTR
jgi:hypothetical protein